MNNPNQGSGPPNQNSGQSTSGIFKAAKKRYQPGVQSTNIIIPKAESFDRHSSENSPSSISFPPAPQPNPIVPSFGDPSKIPQFGNFNVQNTARPGFPPRTVSNIEKGSPSFAPSSTTFGSSFGGIKPSSLFEAKGGASITNTPNNDKPNDVKTTGFGFGSTTGFKAAGEKPNIFGGEKTAKSDLISKNSPGIKFGESNNLSQTTSDKPQATSSLSSFTKPPQGLFGSNTIEKPKDNIFNSSTNIIDKSKSGLFNLPISTDSGGLPPLFGSNNKAGPLPSATSISSMKKKRGAEDDEDSDFNNKRIVNQPIFEAPVKAVESSQKVNQSESGPSLFETKGNLFGHQIDNKINQSGAAKVNTQSQKSTANLTSIEIKDPPLSEVLATGFKASKFTVDTKREIYRAALAKAFELVIKENLKDTKRPLKLKDNLRTYLIINQMMESVYLEAERNEKEKMEASRQAINTMPSSKEINKVNPSIKFGSAKDSAVNINTTSSKDNDVSSIGPKFGSSSGPHNPTINQNQPPPKAFTFGSLPTTQSNLSVPDASKNFLVSQTQAPSKTFTFGSLSTVKPSLPQADASNSSTVSQSQSSSKAFTFGSLPPIESKPLPSSTSALLGTASTNDGTSKSTTTFQFGSNPIAANNFTSSNTLEPVKSISTQNPFSFSSNIFQNKPLIQTSKPESGNSISNEIGSKDNVQNESDNEELEEGFKGERTNDELIKTGKGEEEETSLCEARTKLFQFNKENKSYDPLGVGIIKVNHNIKTGKYRVICRSEGSGSLLLNSYVLPNSIEGKEAKRFKFRAINLKGELSSFAAMFNKPEDNDSVNKGFESALNNEKNPDSSNSTNNVQAERTEGDNKKDDSENDDDDEEYNGEDDDEDDDEELERDSNADNDDEGEVEEISPQPESGSETNDTKALTLFASSTSNLSSKFNTVESKSFSFGSNQFSSKVNESNLTSQASTFGSTSQKDSSVNTQRTSRLDNMPNPFASLGNKVISGAPQEPPLLFGVLPPKNVPLDVKESNPKQNDVSDSFAFGPKTEIAENKRLFAPFGSTSSIFSPKPEAAKGEVHTATIGSNIQEASKVGFMPTSFGLSSKQTLETEENKSAPTPVPFESTSSIFGAKAGISKEAPQSNLSGSTSSSNTQEVIKKAPQSGIFGSTSSTFSPKDEAAKTAPTFAPFGSTASIFGAKNEADKSASKFAPFGSTSSIFGAKVETPKVVPHSNIFSSSIQETTKNVPQSTSFGSTSSMFAPKTETAKNPPQSASFGSVASTFAPKIETTKEVSQAGSFGLNTQEASKGAADTDVSKKQSFSFPGTSTNNNLFSIGNKAANWPSATSSSSTAFTFGANPTQQENKTSNLFSSGSSMFQPKIPSTGSLIGANPIQQEIKAPTSFTTSISTSQSSAPTTTPIVDPSKEAEEDNEELEEGFKGERTNDELIKTGKGEEEETSLCEARTKLLQFNKENKSYDPLGVGIIKVNHNIKTGKYRVICRSEGSGSLLLNSYVLPNSIEGKEAKRFKFRAINLKGELSSFAAMFNKPEDNQSIMKAFELVTENKNSDEKKTDEIKEDNRKSINQGLSNEEEKIILESCSKVLTKENESISPMGVGIVKLVYYPKKKEYKLKFIVEGGNREEIDTVVNKESIMEKENNRILFKTNLSFWVYFNSTQDAELVAKKLEEGI